MYYINLYKPIIIGIILGVIPSFILHIIASVSMLGGFWGFPLSTCSQITTDLICENSVLEVLLESTINQKLRRGRLGITLIIIGFYGCMRISAVFVPISTNDRINKEMDEQIRQTHGTEQKILNKFNNLIDKETLYVTEGYDGNIWFDKIWKRGLYIFMAILIWVIMLVILNLSFSNYYGVNQWFFTFLLKITQIIIEESLKIYIQNELLLGSLSCVIAMTLSVSGLGALNFFEYLFTYFVSLGISTFEKTNQVLVVDTVSDGIFDMVEDIKKWIEKQFDDDDDEIPQHSKSNDQHKEEGNFQGNLENSHEIGKAGIIQFYQTYINSEFENSGIVLTERFEESIDTYDDNYDNAQHFIESPKKRVQFNGKSMELFNQKKKTLASFAEIQLKKQSINSIDSQIDDEEGDEFESKCKRFLNKIKTNKYPKLKVNKSMNQQMKEQKFTLISATIHSHQFKLYLLQMNFQILQTFQYQQPFQVVQMWMFYDASQSFVKWGITKAGLIFYFLFNISNIPFQIVMDLLFLKTVEQFHQIHIKQYVADVDQRFKNRKYNWKTEEETDYLKYIDKDLQYIDHWCFSSQYFFSLSLFVGGSMAIIQGILICLANTYNFFGDEFFLVIVIFWIFTSFIIDLLCVKFYHHTSLWKVEEVNKQEENFNDEIKTTEHQHLIATEYYAKDDHKEKKYTEHIIEETQQAFNQINIFSRESLFIRAGSDAENFVKNAQFFKQSSFMNKNRGIVELDHHRNSLRRDALIDPSHQDLEKQNHNNTIKNTNNSFCQSQSIQQLELNHLKDLIHENRYIKLFFEDAIEQLKYYDISVQDYINQMFEKKEHNNLKLKDKFVQISHILKLEKDPDPLGKEKKWMSFKENIQQSIKLKNKLLKLQDKMNHFKNNEYKDEKFKQIFLNSNKKWFQKHISDLFQDLMIGESSKELLKYRPLILKQFKDIYGEIENECSQTQMNNNQIENPTLLTYEKRSTKSSLNNLISIVKFWHQRSKVLTLAEKCVAGYILRGEKKNCFYCKSNWGITMQLSNMNIEDQFLNFYKKECRRQRQFINIFSLILGTTLNKNKSSIYTSRKLSNRYDNTLMFEMQSHDSINEGSFYDTSTYFVSRQQKFIEQWQEFFIQNSRFINICLKCNDHSQTEFIRQVSQYRQLSLKSYKEDYERYLQFLSKQILEDEESELSQQFINQSIVSSHHLMNIQLQKEESSDQEEISPIPQLICDIVYNANQNKKQGTLLPQNTIIKEENNEDQSYNGDRLSRRESIEFFSPQMQKNKANIRKNLLLKRSQSSIKATYSSPQIHGQRLSTFKIQNGGKNLEELFLSLAESRKESKESFIEQQQGFNHKVNTDYEITLRERKQSDGGQLSFRSAKSFSKTHPDVSQNNTEEINASRRSEQLNNLDNSKYIEEMNKNIEQSQNRSFRILATLNKVSDDLPQAEEINEDDYNINEKQNKQLTIQDINEYLENYKNQKSSDYSDSDSNSENRNQKQSRQAQSNVRLSRNKLTVLLEKSRILKTKSQQQLDEENLEEKDDSSNFLPDNQSKLDEKLDTLMFLNTSQNQQEFISPFKPNPQENEQNLLTENDRFQTELQFTSMIDENNNQSEVQFALFEIKDFPEQ